MPRSTRGTLIALLLSGALIIPSAVSAKAADSPAPAPATTGTYEEQLAAYKVAFDAYKIELDKYLQDRRSAEATYKVAIGKYELEVIAFEEKHKVALAAINETFKNAIDKARTDQRNTQNGTTSPEARNGLRTAMNAAVMAATTTRKNAIDAIGDLPVKPERPVFTAPPVEPRKPMQNLKGNKNQKNSNPQVQPSAPTAPGNQLPAQGNSSNPSKVSKPGKSQNASSNSAGNESDFTA